MNPNRTGSLRRSAASTVWTCTFILLYLLVASSAEASCERTLWRQRLDGYSLGRSVTIGPGGTLYTSDLNRLYAFSPEGELLWTTEGVGLGRQIDFGPDGTIYTGGNLIAAINPDGTVRWRFDNPRNGLDLAAGPNVGPDGNIYAAQDVDGDANALGVFSLDPEGNLRWATRTDYPMISLRGPSFTRVLFAEDRLYMTIYRRLSRPPTIRSYDFDGDLLWYTGDLGLAIGGSPEIHPMTGSLIVPCPATAAISSSGASTAARPGPGSSSRCIRPTTSKPAPSWHSSTSSSTPPEVYYLRTPRLDPAAAGGLASARKSISARPMRSPQVRATASADMPTKKEILAPWRSRLRRSRPLESVPSRWASSGEDGMGR